MRTRQGGATQILLDFKTNPTQLLFCRQAFTLSLKLVLVAQHCLSRIASTRGSTRTHTAKYACQEQWHSNSSTPRNLRKICHNCADSLFHLYCNIFPLYIPVITISIISNTVYLFTKLMELAPQFWILLNLSEEHRLLYFQSVLCPQPPSK